MQVWHMKMMQPSVRAYRNTCAFIMYSSLTDNRRMALQPILRQEQPILFHECEAALGVKGCPAHLSEENGRRFLSSKGCKHALYFCGRACNDLVIFAVMA